MTLPIPGLEQVSDKTVFKICANVVLIPWLTLAVAPKWDMRRTIVFSVVMLECVVYLCFFAAPFYGNEAADVAQTFAEMGTLDGVKKLFTNVDIILPAWVHYLAFDLIVGNYLVERNIADPAGLHQLLMVPVLFLTLMAGPVGVLTYVIFKALYSVVKGGPVTKTS